MEENTNVMENEETVGTEMSDMAEVVSSGMTGKEKLILMGIAGASAAIGYGVRGFIAKHKGEKAETTESKPKKEGLFKKLKRKKKTYAVVNGTGESVECEEIPPEETKKAK